MDTALLIDFVESRQDPQPHVESEFLGRTTERRRLSEENALIGHAGFANRVADGFLVSRGDRRRAYRPLSVAVGIRGVASGHNRADEKGGNTHATDPERPRLRHASVLQPRHGRI